MKKFFSILLAMIMVFTGSICAFAEEYYVEEETVYLDNASYGTYRYYHNKTVSYEHVYEHDITGARLGYGRVTVTYYYDGEDAYIDNYTKKAASEHPDYRVSVSVSEISTTKIRVTVTLVPLNGGSSTNTSFYVVVYPNGSADRISC
ncbi:MAG: hypothetical protein ACI4IT_00970 [Oscillospiraceae bacterium]